MASVLKYILLFLLLPFSRSFTTYCCISIIKKAIVYDKNMPTLYVDNNIKINNEFIHKNIYSLEHIVPRSLIDNKLHNDMHNIMRTFNNLNNHRSNYKYVNDMDYKKWVNLDFSNYVNHKKKLFIPNSNSKGMISRAILYMANEYKYNVTNIIDRDVLIDWFYKYPPKKQEIYHNQLVKDYQKKDNIFISQYNDKKMRSYLEKI